MNILLNLFSEMMAKEKFHKMKKTLFLCVFFSGDIFLVLCIMYYVLWKLSCRDQPVSYIGRKKKGGGAGIFCSDKILSLLEFSKKINPKIYKGHRRIEIRGDLKQ